MSDSTHDAQESIASQPGLIERFNQWFVEQINPLITLMALIASFSACVMLGNLCSKEVLIPNFVRFHTEISMDTQFLPTFSQLYKMAAAKAQKSKYLVIVSGDSIFYGAGQSAESVWSKRLEKILGPDYTVINFAFRGGAALESGYWVLEALSKSYDNVFVVGNTWGAYSSGPIGQTPYSYLFWDAKSHGYLRSYPARDKIVGRFATALTNQDAFYRLGNDMPLQMDLDSVLYFRDLWTTFYYRYFSPMWFINNFLKPRYVYSDTTPTKFPPLGDEEARWIRTISNQHNELITMHADGTYDLLEKPFLALKENLDKSVMPSLRSRILIVQVDACPLFLEKLATPTLAMRKKILESSAQVYDNLGFDSMIINTLQNNDYVDGKHLSPAGGDKIAELIAVRLKELVARAPKAPSEDTAEPAKPGPESVSSDSIYKD